MTRDTESQHDKHAAVFQTSRRVAFVMRSETTARRLSSSRVSRDVMESEKVDVREDPAPSASADQDVTAAAPTEMSRREVDDPRPRSDEDTAPGTATRLRALTSPRGFPNTLMSDLKSAISQSQSSFAAALLFQAEYVDGHTEFLLGFTGVEDGAQDTLESLVNAGLTASDETGIELGIAFLDFEDPMVVRISRVGHRLA